MGKVGIRIVATQHKEFPMKFVNLTPHNIVIHGASGYNVCVMPHGTVARCAVTSKPAGEHKGVPLCVIEVGEVEDLPEPEEGTMYITSMVVRQAVPHRKDVASPGVLLRDDDGAPIGCKVLVINP